ncbi:hypothetical protein HYFRA_00006376 [Hymenoscyphus fraxineus]|uniref:Uncharacterized protein n=1 Tax=Hymenoscyphus fraxineus TaxID=746836 RepID=A0A9N9KP91_9HELO|nr:hypothetical protein HYFRA_00006376 [Hymenoscyphus fraxineus]
MSELDAREAALVLREEAVVIREAQLAAREAAFASKETYTGPETEDQDLFSKTEDEGEVQLQLEQVPEMVSEGTGELAVLELVEEPAAEVDKAKDDLKTEDMNYGQDLDYVAGLEAGASLSVDGNLNEEGVKVKVEDEEGTSQDLTPDSTPEEEHERIDTAPKSQAEPSKVTSESVEEAPPSTNAPPPTLQEDIYSIEETQQNIQLPEAEDVEALKSHVPPQEQLTDALEKNSSLAPIDEPTLTVQEAVTPEPKVESTSIDEAEDTAPVLRDTMPAAVAEYNQEPGERVLAEASSSEPESAAKEDHLVPALAEKSSLPEAQSENTREVDESIHSSASTPAAEPKVTEGENTIAPRENPASTKDEDVSDTTPNTFTSAEETEHPGMPVERKVNEPVEKAEATYDEASNSVKKVTFEAEDASPDLVKQVQDPLKEENVAVNRGLPVQGQSVRV